MATEASLNLKQRAKALMNAGEIFEKLANHGWTIKDLQRMAEVEAAAKDALRASRVWASRRVAGSLEALKEAGITIQQLDVVALLGSFAYEYDREARASVYRHNFLAYGLTLPNGQSLYLFLRLEDISPASDFGEYLWDLKQEADYQLASGREDHPHLMVSHIKEALHKLGLLE